MEKLDLSGEWQLRQSDDNDDVIKGNLPGCNYLDLMNEKIIDDVFYGTNEKLYRWIAEKDWIYKRDFEINDNILNSDYIYLNISGLDTIADIFINDKLIGKGENAHITYKFDVKNYIRKGLNLIEIYLYSPINFVNEKQKKDAFPHNYNGLDGFPHIRKPAYHFGWDWGPILPPSGVSGDIYINAYNKGYINDFKITQEHKNNHVKININTDVEIVKNISFNDYELKIILYDYENKEISNQKITLLDYKINTEIIINNPELWYPNGFKDVLEQPLYRIELQLLYKGESEDFKQIKIGLKTVELDLKKDEYGEQFAFIINGKKIFCKGANWIPSDSFVTRTSKNHLEFLIKSMVHANMNMIRIWGGGYYGSDELYDLCDKYGIMVWQDFQFACAPYPFYDSGFMDNILNEIEDNIKRIRHHASLVLWCGNNEIELISTMWLGKSRFIKSTKKFFFDILPKALKPLDSTPYWYGSPNSGKYLKKVNSDDCGDTHIWSVWHGLQPFTSYQKRFSRFCSEFGFESLPDIDTVKTFAEEKDYDMYSDVMLSHQKCMSGNNKILYYMASNYSIPKKFEDLIYISQLTQAESIKYAVEHMRRNNGRCNGTLFWQLNDCWPVNSWSSIDYSGKWKALNYYSKRFYEPVSISFLREKNQVILYAYNETEQDFKGSVRWKITNFDGKIFDNGQIDVNLKFNEVLKTDTINIEKYLKKDLKCETVLTAEIYDSFNRKIACNTFLFTEEKNLKLKRTDIEKQFKLVKNEIKITLKSNTFVKSVMLHLEGVIEPFSDNFFDLSKNEEKTVTIKINNMKIEDFEKKLSIICLNNVEKRYSRLKETMIKLKIALKPMNIINKIIYKFI